jgi:hypothetical protein
MTLTHPIIITPRLLPGVQIGGAFISVEPTRATDHYGKTKWQYFIDIDGQENSGADLAGWGDTQEMLATLLSFLGAAAESYAYRQRTGRDGENEDLFPAAVVEWAYQNSDELSMLAMELEETPGLIS